MLSTSPLSAAREKKRKACRVMTADAVRSIRLVGCEAALIACPPGAFMDCVGRLEEEVRKKDINAAMHDRTNVPNEFQGSLRYGYLQDAEQRQRIEEDWATVADLPNFEKSIAVTHCNEVPELRSASRYFSDNPYSLRERA